MTDIESFAEERENAEEFADKPMENKFGYYRLGLDIGIASVGWACMACDDAGNVQHILDLGVRAFDVPENPKDGSSLAAPRREKRSLRRRLRRRAFRLERARAVLGVPQENPDDYKKCNARISTNCVLARSTKKYPKRILRGFYCYS